MHRLAFFSHGGFGDRTAREQIPSFTELAAVLSEFYSITIFTPASRREIFHGNASVVPIRARADASFPSLLRSFHESFRSVHRRNRFQILHGFWGYPGGTTAVLLSKLYRVPSVVSILGGEAAALPRIRYGHMQHPFLRRVTLWTCRNTDALVTSTRFQLTMLGRFGLRRRDVRIIPSGVPRGNIRPLTGRTLSPPFRFLHVANLNEVKDQKTVIGAFLRVREHCDAMLRIIGPDHLNGEIQQFVSQCGLRNSVEFTGFVPHEELDKHYHWAHILLQASLYEGQGMVFVEAAAAGAVVCGTHVGLIADLGPEYFVSVEPGRPDELASAILALLRNPVEFARLQENAYRWATEHPMEWTASSYRSLYDELLTDRVPA